MSESIKGKREVESNPFARDDLKVVYCCEGSPWICMACPELNRCNIPDSWLNAADASRKRRQRHIRQYRNINERSREQ